MVSEIINQGLGKVHILPGGKTWFGVTYKEDKEEVLSFLFLILYKTHNKAPIHTKNPLKINSCVVNLPVNKSKKVLVIVVYCINIKEGILYRVNIGFYITNVILYI